MAKWTHPKILPAVSLMLLDLVTIYVSVRFAYYLKYGYWGAVFEPAMLLVAIVVLLGIYILNLYRVELMPSATSVVLNLALASLVSTVFLSSAVYFGEFDQDISVVWRANLISALAIFTVLASGYRVLVRYASHRWMRTKEWLAFGITDTGKAALIAALDVFPGAPSVKVETSDRSLEQDLSRFEGIILGDSVELSDNTKVNAHALMNARFNGMAVLSLPDFYEKYLLRLPARYLRSDWLLVADGFGIAHHELSLKFKRFVDIVVAAVGLVVTCPIMLVTWITVRVSSPGEAIFTQVRAGAQGRDFTIYKFRTMRADAEKDGIRWASEGDERITNVGRFLRMARLDEIPQLWNVLRGDMSFIGPRPERPEFVKELSQKIPFYDLRHLVKPGLTGWAQVMYPYGASVEDAERKLEYDLYYIKNYSIAMDVSIVFRTLRVVLRGAGR